MSVSGLAICCLAPSWKNVLYLRACLEELEQSGFEGVQVAFSNCGTKENWSDTSADGGQRHPVHL